MVKAAIAAAGVLVMSGCALFPSAEEAGLITDESETPTSTASPTATASPNASPSASPTLEPTADPVESQGAIVSQPQGEPVTPEIFLWSIDEEAGTLSTVVMVPGIFENGGTCAVTVTSGSESSTLQRSGEADATATVCGQFVFALSNFSGDSATIVASYESDNYEGSSSPEVVALP